MGYKIDAAATFTSNKYKNEYNVTDIELKLGVFVARSHSQLGVKCHLHGRNNQSSIFHHKVRLVQAIGIPLILGLYFICIYFIDISCFL